jgi:hypothetical protein
LVRPRGGGGRLSSLAPKVPRAFSIKVPTGPCGQGYLLKGDLLFNFLLLPNMSEKRIEELGFKAANKGFFVEWQQTASRYVKEERFKDRVDAYEQAYIKFSGAVVK